MGLFALYKNEVMRLAFSLIDVMCLITLAISQIAEVHVPPATSGR